MNTSQLPTNLVSNSPLPSDLKSNIDWKEWLYRFSYMAQTAFSTLISLYLPVFFSNYLQLSATTRSTIIFIAQLMLLLRVWLAQLVDRNLRQKIVPSRLLLRGIIVFILSIFSLGLIPFIKSHAPEFIFGFLLGILSLVYLGTACFDTAIDSLMIRNTRGDNTKTLVWVVS